MRHEESEWPVNKVVIEQGAAKVEVKKSNSELPDHFNHLYDERAMITINQEHPSWRLNPKRFSSWKRFTRVHAWVRRFVDNCRGRARQNGELKPSEIEDTEVQVIKSAQREAFPEEYLPLQRRKELPKNSKLLAFRPRLDEEGQMRCDSRLKYAEFLRRSISGKRWSCKGRESPSGKEPTDQTYFEIVSVGIVVKKLP